MGISYEAFAFYGFVLPEDYEFDDDEFDRGIAKIHDIKVPKEKYPNKVRERMTNKEKQTADEWAKYWHVVWAKKRRYKITRNLFGVNGEYGRFIARKIVQIDLYEIPKKLELSDKDKCRIELLDFCKKFELPIPEFIGWHIGGFVG